jgi:hypothetical protein
MPPEDKKPPHGVPDKDFSTSEEPTLVSCFACGGEWQTKLASDDHLTYKNVVCAWCVNGSMTAKQIVKWRNHLRLKGQIP